MAKRFAYLDIETTGLSRHYCDLTVVGIAVKEGRKLAVRQIVGDDISADSVQKALSGADEIYTYNGSRFDLPFINARTGLDIKQRFRHTDLMYACWRQNLKGGLKAVERKLGIGRGLTGVDGFMAVRLWWRYVNDHDERALGTLLEYNREDVVNLHELRLKLCLP